MSQQTQGPLFSFRSHKHWVVDGKLCCFCRLLMGLQSTLQELRLADNLLGDNLNPIFSTSEFHGLGQLKLLDLSGNLIKGIEEGILKGCDNLQVQLCCPYRVFVALTESLLCFIFLRSSHSGKLVSTIILLYSLMFCDCMKQPYNVPYHAAFNKYL